MAITTVKSTDEVRIERVGDGAVTIPASTILQWRQRILFLEAELQDLKMFSEGHHAQEESCVWLHALTVDMPHRIELALNSN